MKSNNSLQVTSSIALLIMIGVAAAILTTGFHAPKTAADHTNIDDNTLPDTVTALRQHINKNPKDIDAHQKLALKLYRSGRRDEAISQSHAASVIIGEKSDRAIARLEQETNEGK